MLMVKVISTYGSGQHSYTILFLFPGIRRKCKSKESHRGNQDTGNDEIEEVIKSSSPHVDGEGDINIRLWTTFIHDTVSFSRHS